MSYVSRPHAPSLSALDGYVADDVYALQRRGENIMTEAARFRAYSKDADLLSKLDADWSRLSAGFDFDYSSIITAFIPKGNEPSDKAYAARKPILNEMENLLAKLKARHAGGSGTTTTSGTGTKTGGGTTTAGGSAAPAPQYPIVETPASEAGMNTNILLGVGAVAVLGLGLLLSRRRR